MGKLYHGLTAKEWADSLIDPTNMSSNTAYAIRVLLAFLEANGRVEGGKLREQLVSDTLLTVADIEIASSLALEAGLIEIEIYGTLGFYYLPEEVSSVFN